MKSTHRLLNASLAEPNLTTSLAELVPGKGIARVVEAWTLNAITPQVCNTHSYVQG